MTTSYNYRSTGKLGFGRVISSGVTGVRMPFVRNWIIDRMPPIITPGYSYFVYHRHYYFGVPYPHVEQNHHVCSHMIKYPRTKFNGSNECKDIHVCWDLDCCETRLDSWVIFLILAASAFGLVFCVWIPKFNTWCGHPQPPPESLTTASPAVLIPPPPITRVPYSSFPQPPPQTQLNAPPPVPYTVQPPPLPPTIQISPQPLVCDPGNTCPYPQTPLADFTNHVSAGTAYEGDI